MIKFTHKIIHGNKKYKYLILSSISNTLGKININSLNIAKQEQFSGWKSIVRIL